MSTEHHVRVVVPCGQIAKRTGTSCQSIGLMPDGRCYQHSQTVSKEEKSLAGRRGALATNHRHLEHEETALEAKVLQALPALALDALPDLSTPAKVERFLAETIARSLNGSLPASIARVTNELLQTRLKLVELEYAERTLRMEEDGSE